MTDESSRQKHPEADLLAGFAENSLTRNERESVLSHLAVCARCRQVVFLAHEVEPTPDIRASSDLATSPFWRRNWFPVMASAAAVIVLAAITFFWYGKFNRQTTPVSGEIAQQKSPPVPADNEIKNKAAEVAPKPIPPAAAKQAGRAVAKRASTDGKERQAAVLSSASNSAGASGEEARKLTERTREFAVRQSELSRDSAFKKAQSTGAMQSSAGAETHDKVAYVPPAIQTAKGIDRSTVSGDTAHSSSGASASAQSYHQQDSGGGSGWEPVPESKEVHGEGCVEKGVETGCLIVRDRQSGKLYQVLIKGLRPQPGNGIAFTGVAFDGATYCMQGIPLKVTTWAEQSSLNCAPLAAPQK